MPVDALAISGVLQSFNAISNIGKALLGMRDAAKINEKVIELNHEILSVYQSAHAVLAQQSAMLEEKRALEKKITDLETWNAEKEKYQLADVRTQYAQYGHVWAYVLKKDASSTEPEHYLCQNCYQDGRKSILQEEMRGSTEILLCQRCGSEISRTGEWHGGPRTTKKSR